MDCYGNWDNEEKKRNAKSEKLNAYEYLNRTIRGMSKNEVNKKLSESGLNIKVKNIPFLGGRPERDTVICSDDIVNIKIACGACKSLEEFFQVV